MSYLERLTWVVLTSALFWLSVDKKFSFVALAISCIGFVYFGVLDYVGIGVLASFALLIFLYFKFRFLWIEVLLILGCSGLFLHLIPGFDNPKVLEKVLVSPQSVPHNVYFNLDKTLIPFVLIFLMPTLFFTKDCDYKDLSIPQALLLLMAMGILLFVAVFLGILKPEFHIPTWIFVFLWVNLFFVSYVEEAFFRGYFQQRFSTWLGEYPALILSSLLFALYHLKISTLLAIFAFFAGVIYGLAWLWSGRVWISTLFHFGLNLSHLLFFTYPFARG